MLEYVEGNKSWNKRFIFLFLTMLGNLTLPFLPERGAIESCSFGAFFCLVCASVGFSLFYLYYYRGEFQSGLKCWFGIKLELDEIPHSCLLSVE